MKRISLLAAFTLTLLMFSASGLASPSMEMVITSGLSANLKPRNDLTRLPRAKGEFTVYLRWTGLPTKKKWGFLNDSEPVNYKTMIYDGAGNPVSEEAHSFVPDAVDSVSWVEQTINPGDRSGTWTVVVDAFGKRHQKSIQIYD